MATSTLLFIGCENALCKTVDNEFNGNGYHIEHAHTGSRAMQVLELQQIDLAVLDSELPVIDCLKTLELMKQKHPKLAVILLTDDSHPQTAVEAMKHGVYDYFTKPVDWERLKTVVRNGLLANGLEKEVKKLRKELKEKVGYENVIGVSRRMQDVFCQVEIALKNDVNVHLYGEEGTGKKLLAQTIHFNCTRREKPFVAVNCFSMPESLLEREIFGHNESSISGNTSKTFGKFELANEGTFFLDQIDKMPLAIQLNFLHVLQKHKFNRTENEQKIDIDVRVITATNRNLEDEIKAGRFLKELHDQVKMFPITLPPLRERKEDIPTLTAFFIRRFHDKKKHQVVGISSKAMDYVLNYNWPGNINELKNVIEGAILNTHEGLIQPEHLPLAVTSIRNDTENKARNDIQTMLRFSKNIVPLEEIEKEALMHALKTTNYNMSTAANALGIGRTTIYRKVHKYGIPVPRLNWAGL